MKKWTIANTEARYMLDKATVKLWVYDNGEGGAWYATINNGVQHERVIELGFGIEAVSELITALLNKAEHYDTISTRCKRTAERHAAIATSAAFSDMAAAITHETTCASIMSLYDWLVSKDF